MTNNSTPAAAAALAAIRTHRTANPWLSVALDRVQAAQRGTVRQRELVATRGEYDGHEDDSRPCRCGQRLWFRTTVGAYSCPDCGALQTQAGRYLD